MDIKIGNQIKELRKAHKMTQEQLAELVGISFQAVSKWENNIALPDITLIPKLASIFGVSTDEIFAYDRKDVEADVERICNEAYKFRFSDPVESRRILDEGLEKYPDNDIILNNILCVVDYNENPDETIRIASHLVDKTRLDDVRYDALRFLSYAYKAKGDMESAAAALEQIPEIYFTKLEEMAFVLTGEPKRKAARTQKWISFESMIEMMKALSECYEAEGKRDEARAELTRAVALMDAMRGDEVFDKNFTEFESEVHARLAKWNGK